MFSFNVNYLGEMTAEPNTCPVCGNDLTKDNAVFVQTTERQFKTKIGDREPYTGYVMDGNMDDTTLILADDYPDIRCSECGEPLQQDNEEEVG